MTVIVEDQSDGRVVALTKGAESSLEKLILDDERKTNAYQYVEEFAEVGLRTLGNLVATELQFRSGLKFDLSSVVCPGANFAI